MSSLGLAGRLLDWQFPIIVVVSADVPMCALLRRSCNLCWLFQRSVALAAHEDWCLSRHLLAHLGFQDIVPQADGPADDGGLAAHAESLQLTSPRSAPGTSPPQHMPEANGNTFKEEGAPCLPFWHNHVSPCTTCMLCQLSCSCICTTKEQTSQQSQLTGLSTAAHRAQPSLVSCHSAMLSVLSSFQHIRSPDEQFNLQHDSLWRCHADGESFFENLPQAELPAPQFSRTSTLSPRPITAEEHHAEAGESEGDIQRALYVGNYEAAVNTCLQVAFHTQSQRGLPSCIGRAHGRSACWLGGTAGAVNWQDPALHTQSLLQKQRSSGKGGRHVASLL